MGWVESLQDAGYPWARSNGYNNQGPYRHSQTGRSNTGVEATPEVALKISAWFGAFRILSEQFSMPALKLYRRTKNGGKELATDDPLFKLLYRKPNQDQNSLVYRSHIFGHHFWNGNSFSYISHSDVGFIAELIPLAPSRVQIVPDKDVTLFYRYTDMDGKTYKIQKQNMLHWIGPTEDGITGISRIKCAANHIGIQVKRQGHQEHLLENGAKPSGIYTVPGKLQEQEFKDLARRIREQNQGPENSGQVILLDNGSQYEATSMSNQDLEYIASAKMDIDDVSRFTGVPSILLSQNENTSLNNMLEANRAFLKYGMNPILVSHEMLLNTQLIPANKQDKLFFEYDRSDFDKMDLAKTAEWVKNMRYAGCISANEGRTVFNLSPVTDQNADDLLRPENMAPAAADYEAKNPTPANQDAADQSQQEPAKDNQKPAKKQDKKVKNSLESALFDVFSDVFDRIYSKTALKFEALKKKQSGEALETSLFEFLGEQREIYSSWVRPGVLAVVKASRDMTPSAELAVKRICYSTVDSIIDQVMLSVKNSAEQISDTTTYGALVSTIFENAEV